MTTLYRLVELPSDEPVQYVACYVLRWGRPGEPEVAFVPATQEDIDEAYENKGDYWPREDKAEV